jgi:hypothetical protein
MHVEPSFIADCEPPGLVEICEAAFHHPSMAAELRAGAYAALGDAWFDAPTQAGASAAPVIVDVVGMQLLGLPRLSGTGGTTLIRSSKVCFRDRWPRSAERRAGCRAGP